MINFFLKTYLSACFSRLVLTVFSFDSDILSGDKPRILAPERCDDHPRHFCWEPPSISPPPPQPPRKVLMFCDTYHLILTYKVIERFRNTAVTKYLSIDKSVVSLRLIDKIEYSRTIYDNEEKIRYSLFETK